LSEPRASDYCERRVVSVREAIPDDAAEAARVMRRSIRELCAADHRNEESALADWLENKTTANVRQWIESSANDSVVVEREGRIIGFGVIGDTGEILLLYIDPSAAGSGAGSVLLDALEEHARRRGLRSVWLESTVTAKGWYQRRGFEPRSSMIGREGRAACHPMEKRLAQR
jgi:N-acetylglutamate synthase-like GNAT family acetyltransferase